MTPTRILIIDDEFAIRQVLRLNLEAQGYELHEAANAREGLAAAASFHPHLVLLDLGLPDQNGYEVLKSLRAWTEVPVIVLTVIDDDAAKVRLLDAGADDYLTKPFSVPELLARVRVGLRTHGLVEATPVFESGDLRVDLNARTVTRAGQPVKLTKTEFELLARLVRQNGRVVSHATLLKQIWGAKSEDQSHYSRIYINQLRKKLEANPSNPLHIQTEAGVGYRLT